MSFYLLSSKSKVHDNGDVFIELESIASIMCEKQRKEGKYAYLLKIRTKYDSCLGATFDEISDLRQVLVDLTKYPASYFDNYIDKLMKEKCDEENNEDHKKEKMKEILEQILK